MDLSTLTGYRVNQVYGGDCGTPYGRAMFRSKELNILCVPLPCRSQQGVGRTDKLEQVTLKQ
ncbi:unnamed protein product [Anisakis simplex]|uniref:Transposase n=1 Tax=Anisakis simplex TaxID=6269 RepID=A0A0M3K6S4_ANISI|nr:unnamed protein product [Anisakis simplex]